MFLLRCTIILRCNGGGLIKSAACLYSSCYKKIIYGLQNCEKIQGKIVSIIFVRSILHNNGLVRKFWKVCRLVFGLLLNKCYNFLIIAFFFFFFTEHCQQIDIFSSNRGKYISTWSHCKIWNCLFNHRCIVDNWLFVTYANLPATVSNVDLHLHEGWSFHFSGVVFGNSARRERRLGELPSSARVSSDEKIRITPSPWRLKMDLLRRLSSTVHRFQSHSARATRAQAPRIKS